MSERERHNGYGSTTEQLEHITRVCTTYQHGAPPQSEHSDTASQTSYEQRSTLLRRRMEDICKQMPPTLGNHTIHNHKYYIYLFDAIDIGHHTNNICIVSMVSYAYHGHRFYYLMHDVKIMW